MIATQLNIFPATEVKVAALDMKRAMKSHESFSMINAKNG
jgi:hypothetical protein